MPTRRHRLDASRARDHEPRTALDGGGDGGRTTGSPPVPLAGWPRAAGW
ncbi:MAG: hypothetical protein R2719_12545 [Micropruina sp.]